MNVLSEPIPVWGTVRFECPNCKAVVQFTWKDKRSKALRSISQGMNSVWRATARCDVCWEDQKFVEMPE